MKVTIFGPMFDQTGYARHTRSLANAMHEIGIDVKIDTAKVPQWERFANDFELIAIDKPFDHEATMIVISQPQFWPLALATKPKQFFGFCVWEGDKVPEYWKEYLFDARVDKILVPSQHTLDAIHNTFNSQELLDKLVIVHHGVDTSMFYPVEKSKEKLCFLANKGWSQGINDRGGMQFLIQAYAEEFTKKDNVELKIKINSVYNQPGWNFQAEIEKLGIPDKNRAPLLITTDQITDEALRDFYNNGHVFVSPSMGEAFNLPCLEAMACGLPVITTFFGGQADFVDNDNGWILTEGTMGHYSIEPAYKEVQWFKPSIKSIRRVLRQIYDNQDIILQKKELALIRAKQFTWRESAKKIKSLLTD